MTNLGGKISDAVPVDAILTPVGKIFLSLARRDYSAVHRWQAENNLNDARRREVPDFTDALLKLLAELRFPQGSGEVEISTFCRSPAKPFSDLVPYDERCAAALLGRARGLPFPDALDFPQDKVSWHLLQLIVALVEDLGLLDQELAGCIVAVERCMAHRRGDVYPMRPGYSPLEREISTHAPSVGLDRIDFGGILVPRFEGVTYGVKQVNGSVQEVVVGAGNLEMRLQAFSASPRSGNWKQIREEITGGQLIQQGVLAEEVSSRLGVELWLQFPIVHDGKPKVHFIRTLACDGPGWLLKAAIGGDDAFDAKATASLERVYEEVFVVPSKQRLMPRTLIPLRLPQ